MPNPPDDEQRRDAEPDADALDASMLAAFTAHRATILRTVPDAEPVTTLVLDRLLSAGLITMTDFEKAFRGDDPRDAVVVWSPRIHRGLVTVFVHHR